MLNHAGFHKGRGLGILARLGGSDWDIACVHGRGGVLLSECSDAEGIPGPFDLFQVIDTQYYEPGDLFELLPNEARIGNGAHGVEFILPSALGEPAHYLATVPVIQLTAVIHNGSK